MKYITVIIAIFVWAYYMVMFVHTDNINYGIMVINFIVASFLIIYTTIKNKKDK